MLRKWQDLPQRMQIAQVHRYYEYLERKRLSLTLKRVFDIMAGLVLLALFALPMLILAGCIALDSPGGVLYRQVRITAYGKEFRIHKFRTMVSGADRMGSHVTAGQDSRISRIGAVLRKYRLDELPQLIDVIQGNMSFVGTRPEVPEYVEQYTPEMLATLLLPAGITSEASIRFKDEAKLLEGAEDVDRTYVEVVLPRKMEYNLASLEQFSCRRELLTMVRTLLSVLGIIG